VFETATDEEREELVERSIEIIARIQAATETAFQRNSIASRLAFDEAKLSWELNFFFEHYFGSLRKEDLREAEAAELRVELMISLMNWQRSRACCAIAITIRRICWLTRKDRIRVVDHQDARMGPASYDLVSLLTDRQPDPPSLAEMRAHRLHFLDERRRQALPAIDPDDFAKEFRLMTIQRGLKAIGTFSYQTAVCGRGAFLRKNISLRHF